MCYDFISFLLYSITFLQATHQDKMESFLLYVCFPFIRFLLIRYWPSCIDFICLLSFYSYFQCLCPFCSIFWKTSQLYFLSILLHLKILAIGPPALFTSSFWRISWLISHVSPPFFWSWFEWRLPLLLCMRSTILFPTLSSRNMQKYLVHWCPICSQCFYAFTSLCLF